MKCLKMLALAAIGAAILLAIAGGSVASAETVLCTEKANPCEGKADGTGTEIKASLVSGTQSKLTTIYKTIACGTSSVNAKVTSTGEKVNASVQELTSKECNCEVVVLLKGTLELAHISGTDDATVQSNGTEVTVQCNETPFGKVHCIYATEHTDIGTLEGGNPAKLKVNVELPGLTTNPLCSNLEGEPFPSRWEAEYEVTSPKPLYVGPVEEEPPPPPPAETVLCTESKNPCPDSKADGAGTEIKASLFSGTKSTITTSFKTIECGKSSLTAKVTSTGKAIGSGVEALSFEECNCEVKVLSKGTLELEAIAKSVSATVKSNGTEITTACSTIFGNVHCVYKTEATQLGTLAGGSPASLSITVELLRQATNELCDEESVWHAAYEVTTPKPLYVEPETEPTETILCTEKAAPCPEGKADGNGTEIKASLVSGTKSKLTTPYNNIECGKASLTAKVTSTGKTIGASVEGLSFEECNCEVKVLAKGTFELKRITNSENATATSTGTETTTSCETLFGKVHCIYKTEATDLGTLEGGNPAKIKISGANVLRLATDTRCNEGTEGAKWDVEYEITSPKPLYMDPR